MKNMTIYEKSNKIFEINLEYIFKSFKDNNYQEMVEQTLKFN